MSNFGVKWGGNKTTSYIVKRRDRVQWQTSVMKANGGHTRRVWRWSKWKRSAMASTAIAAEELFERERRLAAGCDVGVFFSGKRLTVEQLRARAKVERDEINLRVYGTESP